MSIEVFAKRARELRNGTCSYIIDLSMKFFNALDGLFCAVFQSLHNYSISFVHIALGAMSYGYGHNKNKAPAIRQGHIGG